MLHHREMYIKHRYRILTMLMCTQLRNSICDAEQSLLLVETGLELEAGTSSFVSSPSQSVEKVPHISQFLVWGHGKQARITILHCTCQPFRVSS